MTHSLRQRTVTSVVRAGCAAWLACAAFSAVGADIEEEISRLQAEANRLAAPFRPCMLQSRASIESLYGAPKTITPVLSKGPAGDRLAKYGLRVPGVTLYVGYVDGYARHVSIDIGGSINNRQGGPPREHVLSQLKRRVPLYRQIVDAYAEELAEWRPELSEQTCDELIEYLGERPDSILCDRIVRYLPESCDERLLPAMLVCPSRILDIHARLHRIIKRKPELAGAAVGSLKDERVSGSDWRRLQIEEVLWRIAGYPDGRAGNPPTVAAEWWAKWWDRHQNHSRLQWLQEPLSLVDDVDAHRSACAGLAALSDPAAKPILKRMLDDGDREVRARAAVGLLRWKHGRDYLHGRNRQQLMAEEPALVAEAREWAAANVQRVDEDLTGPEHGP